MKHFIRQVNRSWGYFKASWGGYDFDYSYSLKIFGYSLSRLCEAIENGDTLDRDQDVKRLKTMIMLLDRISNDWQVEEKHHEHMDKLFGPSKWKYVKTDQLFDGQPTYSIEEQNKLRDSDQAKIYRKHLFKKIEQIKNNDLQLFAKLFTKHIKGMWT